MTYGKAKPGRKIHHKKPVDGAYMAKHKARPVKSKFVRKSNESKFDKYQASYIRLFTFSIIRILDEQENIPFYHGKIINLLIEISTLHCVGWLESLDKAFTSKGERNTFIPACKCKIMT